MIAAAKIFTQNVPMERVDKRIKILLVDTDKELMSATAEYLSREGNTVFTSSNSQQAIEIATKELPQLVLLELALPDMDGIELIQELTKINRMKNTMYVFLTSRNHDYEQIAALDSGADDYIIKPVKFRVLTKRLDAILKRKKQLSTALDTGIKGLRINEEYFMAYVDEKETELSKKEFEILALLFSAPGKTFSRKEIAEKVWEAELKPGSRTLDVHLRNLRVKIGEHYIKTIKKVGFYLDTAEAK